MELISCQVCTYVTEKIRRNGCYVCQPCRRFFIRHARRRDLIRCIVGDGLCYERSRASPTPNLRNLCQACRLEKCLNVGMQSRTLETGWTSKVGRPRRKICETSNTASNSSYPFVNCLEGLFNTFEIEKYTSDILTAGKTFMLQQGMASAFDHTELAFLDDNFVAEKSANVKMLCRSMPGFNSLNLTDKCSLFAFSYFSILTTQCYLSHNSQKLSILGFSCSISNAFLLKFPRFKYLYKEKANIESIFAEWNPCVAEACFLKAMLFYNTAVQYCMINQEDFGRCRKRIDILYETYMSRNFGSYYLGRVLLLRKALSRLNDASARRFLEIIAIKEELYENSKGQSLLQDLVNVFEQRIFNGQSN